MSNPIAGGQISPFTEKLSPATQHSQDAVVTILAQLILWGLGSSRLGCQELTISLPTPDFLLPQIFCSQPASTSQSSAGRKALETTEGVESTLSAPLHHMFLLMLKLDTHQQEGRRMYTCGCPHRILAWPLIQAGKDSYESALKLVIFINF